MKCIHCEVDIETDDNFCWNCGHWTTKGYSFLKGADNVKMIMSGTAIKQEQRFSLLMSLLAIGIILFVCMIFIRGNDLFKPFIYLKKQFTNYMYGYNTSVIKTDNKYNGENIDSYEEAIEFIKKDFSEQAWLCENDLRVSKLEHKLQDNLKIPSVSFCDISYDVAFKLGNVIFRMYDLFPNISGALTNITVTNANSSDYIAYFQPLYQFVNINSDISSFNKVNKTQILLNSYYFLNSDIMNTSVGNFIEEDWYVDGATWESVVAHEIGHYISFVILLREHGLDNITFVNSSNNLYINNVIDKFNNGSFSTQLVNEALNNYNLVHNTNVGIDEFASSISKYAFSKDNDNNLIADELVAEAIHDYYLHGDNMSNSSREIIKIIKNRLY